MTTTEDGQTKYVCTYCRQAVATEPADKGRLYLRQHKRNVDGRTRRCDGSGMSIQFCEEAS